MDSLHFNWVDYIVLALVLLTTISGFSRGLIKEIFSLITLAAAYVVATMFSSNLATSITSTDSVQQAMNQMSQHSANGSEPVSMLALGLSFTILFIGTMVLGSIVCFIINYAFNRGAIGLGNRFLGGLFGIVKGLAICVAFVFIFQLTAMGESGFWRESFFVKQMQPAVEMIGKEVSPSLANLKERFEKTMQSVAPEMQNMMSPSAATSNTAAPEAAPAAMESTPENSNATGEMSVTPTESTAPVTEAPVSDAAMAPSSDATNAPAANTAPSSDMAAPVSEPTAEPTQSAN